TRIETRAPIRIHPAQVHTNHLMKGAPVMRTLWRTLPSLGAAAVVVCAGASALANDYDHNQGHERVQTTTPIKHVVVIFQENVSFDHYFGTYPNAANPAGEPRFTAVHGTPRVDNLLHGSLLTQNPNLNVQNAAG